MTEDILTLSPEWRAARRGLVTASRFKDVCTKSRNGKKWYGETARSYAMDLIAEMLTSEPAEEMHTSSMDHGNSFEREAIEAYQAATFNLVQPGKLVMPWPDRRIGGTPDGFVGKQGIVEVKCPFNSAIHLKTITYEKMPTEHRYQVQGNLWLTDRQWLDFICYDPRINQPHLRLYIDRVMRDDILIRTEIAPVVSAFEDAVMQMLYEAEAGRKPVWPETIEPSWGEYLNAEELAKLLVSQTSPSVAA